MLALALGCPGLIGTTYNYLPELYVAMAGAFTAGDLCEARRLQSEANGILGIVKRYGGLAASRAALAFRGLDLQNCRGPALSLPPEQCAALFAELQPFAQSWLRPVSY